MIRASQAEPLFRFAEQADVDDIVTLVHSAYRGEASTAGWTTEAHLLEGQRTDASEIAEVIAAAGSVMILAIADAAIVGCCQLQTLPDAVSYFGTFSVAPSKQGGGLGKLILATAETTARTLWSAKTMEMTVIDQRPDLIAWYERRGYRRTGEQRAFPYGNTRFGLPLREDLVFAVLAKDISDG